MENTEFETPPELVESFKEIEGGTFPDIQSLIFRVREISDHYYCRYISLSTGCSRSLQIFSCHHKTSMFNCAACVRFYYNADSKIAHFHSCDKYHSHPIGELEKNKKRNNLTKNQIEEIKKSTIAGNTAYSIRMKQGLTCSKDVLYSARRKEIQSLKENQMRFLFEEMKQWNNWTNLIVLDSDRRFESCYVFHNPIISASYAKDLCVVDDTSCTNFYGLPLYVMISEDENSRNQVLSFSIMSSRTKESFVNYFKEVKARVNDIRLFICDRNKTQISALREVFPNCLIIYCLVHIGRNIYSKVGVIFLPCHSHIRNRKLRRMLIIFRSCQIQHSGP